MEIVLAGLFICILFHVRVDITISRFFYFIKIFDIISRSYISVKNRSELLTLNLNL